MIGIKLRYIAGMVALLFSTSSLSRDAETAEFENIFWVEKVYSTLGARYRSASLLSACGQENLAEVVADAEGSMRKVMSLATESTKNRLEPDPGWLAWETFMRLKAYQQGYSDMAHMMMKHFTDGEGQIFCDAATRKADELIGKSP